MPDLSILCVTRAEKGALPLLRLLPPIARMLGAELVLVADGQKAFDTLAQNEVGHGRYGRLFEVETKGYIESVLDTCLYLTPGRYVLRIDDDETLSPPLVEWLADRKYQESDHWKFSRAHLWLREMATDTGDDEVRVIASPPLWPDHQTRLSTRDKSFGRTHIHCGSPHGGGELAPFPLIHHKFVIKSRQEREEIVKRYESVQPGAGSGFRYFSVPEMVEEEGGKLETISYHEFVQRGYTV